MKTLYEGILGDIEDTINKSDKASERISLGIPEYNDCKKSNSHYGVVYIWKLPPKILNVIKARRDEILSKYEWLSTYDRTADNIVVYCSTRKFYINLCTDNTISGIRLVGGAPGSGQIFKDFCKRSYDENQNIAYTIISHLADMDNLKYLFDNGGPENKKEFLNILKKLTA